ncbi:cytochrome P450 [Rhodococcus sp. D2-41]|uniref:Cytochrome P450 n=1 Tax=Speluncibacter jeojiensis TaxID=2710754 RepID=A0A9X4LZC7_9ACTN|nr:cytochrome P450 [Rhodococcus sp. D2-41]MDG3011494.1 cytochrome P450 [Rhodococcus sp. D2-41]MDG3015150.1 cytochrome P450 [Corynebacteriales bacterium D3-21]
MTQAEPTTGIPSGLDPTDPDLYERGVPAELFARLRRTAPVLWCPQPPGMGGFADEGYWAVTRHADVREVSHHNEIYSSWQNTAIVRFEDDLPRENIDMQRAIMLNKDEPEHTKLRRIVSRGFTPRAIESLRGVLSERAEAIVTRALANGSGNFVTEVACELPLQAIAELLGVPQADRGKLFDWTNQMVGSEDPEFREKYDPITSVGELLGYSYQLADERRRCPADDIITKLVQADVDGERLSPEEFGFFMLLLAVAGNETTRNATSLGMIAFLDNPEPWELFKAERPSTAADEIVRWATPVRAFQRTALSDTELGGQHIRKGDRVAMFYASANFDEEVFENPYTFDITRDPNPHVGFGAAGVHYCIGHNLAKMEIDLIFGAIADHMPDLARLGDPRRLRSSWLSGIKEFPVDFSGGCPVAH